MKYCPHCGNEVYDDAVACPHCGCSLSVNGKSVALRYDDKQGKNGYAVAGLILAFFIPLLGWIFGGIGLSKANEREAGKGLSIAAIVIATIMFFINFYLIMQKMK